MSEQYTEFEKRSNGNLRIVLLEEARESVQEIASKEIEADSKLAETIDGNSPTAGQWCGPRTSGR